MAVLDKVAQMQSLGMGDDEIIRNLRNEGFTPQQINDALNQSQVKSAVSQYPETQDALAIQNMQQSIMPQYPEQAPKYSEQAPAQQEYYYPETTQAYPEQAYYPQESLDTETITEIAEQVIIEKIQELNKELGNIPAFKAETKEKNQNLDERLKKIENSIEKLQQAIIGKIGEFGESSAAIHKDLDNLHNTVSKLMNPLIDNYHELKKIAGKSIKK